MKMAVFDAITSPPKVIWEKRVAAPHGGRPQFTPKCAPSLRRSQPSSNAAIPQPTPLTNPNGIRIQSAILPQYTFRADRQTDRPTLGIGDRSVIRALTLYYIDNQRRANNIARHCIMCVTRYRKVPFTLCIGPCTEGKKRR